jgi:hypothetical protein
MRWMHAMDACDGACTPACIRNMHACVCMCACMHMYACMCACVHMYACMCTRQSVGMYACVCAYVRMCVPV